MRIRPQFALYAIAFLWGACDSAPEYPVGKWYFDTQAIRAATHGKLSDEDSLMMENSLALYASFEFDFLADGTLILSTNAVEQQKWKWRWASEHELVLNISGKNRLFQLLDTTPNRLHLIPADETSTPYPWIFSAASSGNRPK
ncbi:MAG TPA: hypothetical protein PKA00_16240 [Saprospiraceae bacterium]|nr:hypothetical protein [Saprospiraceae bacterium]HMQ84465.1 hypothetical protein [Saprospiraceae bacterium]